MGAAALSGAACQSEPSDLQGDPICLNEDCSDAPSPPISGNAILDCWITPAGARGADPRFDLLECRYEPPLAYPTTLVGATVSALSGRGEVFSADIEEIGEIKAMAYIDPSAYPIELDMDIRFDSNDHRVAALEGLDKVTTKVMVGAAADLASDRPASAHIPFQLWEVNLLGRSEEFSALSFGYSIDTGAGQRHDVAFKTRPLLFGRAETFYLPVDADTFAVDATMALSKGTPVSATVTGPGTYSVKDGTLQRAEQADLPQLDEDGSGLASCWFDNSEARFEQLFCQGHQQRGVDLDGAFIEVLTANGKHERTAIGNTPTWIATVSPGDFPVKVDMVGSVSTDVIGLQSLAGRSLRASATVSGKEIPREASRRSIRAPFSVWPVRVENKSEGFQGLLDSYVIELGDGMIDRFASLVADAEIPFVPEGTAENFLVAAPAGVYEMIGNGFMLVGGQAQEVEFVLRPGTLLVGE